MKVYPNGTRYEYTALYDDVLNQPYDYSRNGLLKHLMSARITNTQNPVTRLIVDTFEKEITTLLKVVDVLANFKNPYFKNR